jgi:hypothetical protein
MDVNFLQKQIEAKAQKRVDADIKKATEALRGNPVLVQLTIKNGDDRLSLVSNMGYCPATDLFGSADSRLLEEHTSFRDVVARLKDKYIEEETDLLLSSLKAVVDLAQSRE